MPRSGSLSGFGLEALGEAIDASTLTAAQAVVEGEDRGVYITGAQGSGKSTLAAAIFAELCGARRSRGRPAWVEFPRDALVLEDEHTHSERRELVRALRAKGALVIDGLTRLGGRQQRDLVAAAIDTRIDAGAPLIVTGDVALDDLAEQVGTRTAGRLASHCSEIGLGRGTPKAKRRSG